MADTPQDDLSAGDLRRMLAEQTAKNEQQAAQLLAFQQDQQLRDAGFGHLSQRQRRAILRDLAEDGTDFSAEAVKEIAQEYGYPLTPPTTTGTPANDAGQGQNGNGQQGNGQSGQSQDQGQDQDKDASLTALDLMAKAQRIASGNAGESDFESQIQKTNSPAELTELIRTKGARHGIVHEWDVP